MGESDKNRKKVKNRTFQTKYHYGLNNNVHNSSVHSGSLCKYLYIGAWGR